MKKIKQIALSVLGMAVIATGLVACSSDDSSTSIEENKETQMSVNSVNGNDMTYQDFHLSNGDGVNWWSDADNECNAEEGEGCFSDIIIIRDREKVFIKNLMISNVKQVILQNQSLAYELFHPTVVDGVLDDFFTLEGVYNINTDIHYVKVLRINDKENIGVYQFRLK